MIGVFLRANAQGNSQLGILTKRGIGKNKVQINDAQAQLLPAGFTIGGKENLFTEKCIKFL